MLFVKALKRTTIVLMMLIFSLTIMTTTRAAEAKADDLQGHWAETLLRNWSDQGLLKGYEGKFYPDKSITRAEFITLINRAFELKELGTIQFKDLESSHWAYNQFITATKAGYIEGYNDNTVRPDLTVTREEAAVMVAKLTNLIPESNGVSTNFKDDSSISSWSKDAVSALATKSIIIGNTEGNFKPKSNLTRAEAVTMLNKSLDYKAPKVTTYDKAGVYGPSTGVQTIKGNVIVSAPGVTLQNTIIEGDLTLTEGVGEGDAYFKKVNVKGTTTINGGGANSVHFEDSALVRISIDKQTGVVRVAVVGASSIKHVVINSPVKLEESSLTDSGFENVEISKALPAGSEVQLLGHYEDVRVESSDIKISIANGSVKQLNVEKGVKNAEIDVNANSKIMDLILNAVAKIIGQGTVENATINSDAAGSSFQKTPGAVSGEAANTIQTPPASGNTSASYNSEDGKVIGGGGSGNNNSGGNTGGDNTGGGNPNNGNDNNGNNPSPVSCTGSPDECRFANLVDLSVSEFTLNQLDANQYTTGQTGFNPETFDYSIVTERNMMDSVQTAITVTKSTYSTVKYSVLANDYSLIKSGTITEDNPTFNLEIKGMQDIRTEFTVTSGDGISVKKYVIYIQYPRTIQEGLKIDSVIGRVVNNGVFIGEKKSYRLVKGSVNGVKLNEKDSVLLFDDQNSIEPFLTCNYVTCTLPENKFVPESTGTWKVEIIHDGELFASGDYKYDFTTAPLLTTDIGLKAEASTKQELIDLFIKWPDMVTPFKYGYSVTVDMDKLRLAFPTAKFITENSYEMYEPKSTLPDGLSIDELKVNITPIGIYSYSSSTNAYLIPLGTGKRTIAEAYYHQFENDTEKIVNDKFVYIVLYDQNYNLIGQYITVLKFDEDHVADGYTAVGNWNPAP